MFYGHHTACSYITVTVTIYVCIFNTHISTINMRMKLDNCQDVSDYFTYTRTGPLTT